MLWLFLKRRRSDFASLCVLKALEGKVLKDPVIVHFCFRRIGVGFCGCNTQTSKSISVKMYKKKVATSSKAKVLLTTMKKIMKTTLVVASVLDLESI